MMGSDGHMVISDPFFLGWNHPDLKADDPWRDEPDDDSEEGVDGSMERSFQNSDEEDPEDEVGMNG